MEGLEDAMSDEVDDIEDAKTDGEPDQKRVTSIIQIGRIRRHMNQGHPWFCAHDVAVSLGY